MNKIYPHKCKVCNSPSRNNKDITLCSNSICKSWKKYKDMVAPKEQGLTDANPIRINCSKCGKLGGYDRIFNCAGYCSYCNLIFGFNVINNRWYLFRAWNNCEYAIKYINSKWDEDHINLTSFFMPLYNAEVIRTNIVINY